MDQYPVCRTFSLFVISVLSPFSTQLIVKVSCKCGMTIRGARLNQNIACAGQKKGIRQLLVVSGGGWGLHSAATFHKEGAAVWHGMGGLRMGVLQIRLMMSGA